ncbi:hypothetical protein KFV08_07705 [Macrococcoides canis]|uniref:hypothetical protein n=1 Tax=Macrococcoides canis TaxID=1855823 RepID=UPI00207CE125|nr:hypothetical protein [Macrococcus canis]MCO4095701.1 hypothetical protein [Macrococcus canis]UTH08410.1 hypothetical protein KFV08_07705 [Macrococcus canis]
MNRNYEKELGLTQQRLSESTAREVMYTAMIDDLTVENEALNKKIEELESQLNN